MISFVSAVVLTLGVLLTGIYGLVGDSRQVSAAASLEPITTPVVVGEFPWQGHRG